ncbi:MAG: efflux RND transporter periplasmic adaptor subunit [Desulfurivibrionaceae bacterium]
MKTVKRKHIPLFRRFLMLLMSMVVPVFVWGCQADDKNRKNEDQTSEPCISVDLKEVKTEDLEEIIPGIGGIQGFQSVVIKPEIDGIIESVHFEEGTAVEKDDLLFTIDNAKIQTELKARQAALQEARAKRKNARLVYNRRQNLFEQELGSKEARDEARTNYQALSAQVKRLKAEIENIKETLKDTHIRAPFDGTMGERLVDAGQLVNTSTSLTSIVQLDRLKIAFTVPERYLGDIEPGKEIRLTTPAYPDKHFPGTIYFVSPQIAEETRNLMVKAHADNPEDLLRPGGFVSVELISGIRENVPVIPEEALIPTREGYMVFTVEDSRAKGRDVEIGLRKPGRVEITSGLEEGETVVRAGHIDLNEDDLVCKQQE